MRSTGNLQSTLQVIHKSGNSFGENRRRRGRWTKELDFEVKDARKEPVDVLWFVGDYASFDPRSQHVSRTIARLLHEAGVDFGILYDGERNAGNDVRRVGEEGLFESLAEQNIATLSGAEFNRDRHQRSALTQHAAQRVPASSAAWPVVHHTTLLLELIESGRLDVGGRRSYKVTSTTPVTWARFNGEYDAPRRILELLGCELVEMPRNRDNSFCCGAGGGRIWIPDEPGVERPSENRIHEALSLGDVDFFVVTCPKDVTMYEDAIKTTGNSDRIELRELTELVEEAVQAAVPVAGGRPGRSPARSRSGARALLVGVVERERGDARARRARRRPRPRAPGRRPVELAVDRRPSRSPACRTSGSGTGCARCRRPCRRASPRAPYSGTSSPSMRSVVSRRGVPSAAIRRSASRPTKSAGLVELDDAVEADLERIGLVREVVDVGEQQARLDPQRLDRRQADRAEARAARPAAATASHSAAASSGAQYSSKPSSPE